MAGFDVVLEVGYRSMRFRTMKNLPVGAVVEYQETTAKYPDSQLSAALTLLQVALIDSTDDNKQHLRNVTVQELTDLLEDWMVASA